MSARMSPLTLPHTLRVRGSLPLPGGARGFLHAPSPLGERVGMRGAA
jgi:hypothetical protein